MFLSVRVHQPDKAPRTPFKLTVNSNDFLLGNESGSIVVRLRRRTAYPHTFCRQRDAHSFELGYGKYNSDHHDEFLNIIIYDDGRVVVERDAYCTLPIFYSVTEDVLMLTNLYPAILRATPSLTISRMAVQYLLMPLRQYRYPPFQEIHILDERQRLTYDSNGVHVQQPSPRPWLVSKDAPTTDPRDFRRQFESFLDYFVSTRLMNQTFACHISGGIDSATLPLYLYRKRRMPSRPLALSLLMNGASAASFLHRKNVAATVELTNFQLLTVPLHPGVDMFFSHLFSLDTYIPSYPEASFQDCLKREIALLQEADVDVLCTGNGGDEIFENIVDPAETLLCGEIERDRRRHAEGRPFLTERFYREYIASTPEVSPFPAPLHSHSMLGLHAGNNFYIEAGIWPVSPFADPSLYAYCQGLPAHFRANKNILRMYHAACGIPEDIYSQPKQNDFTEILDTPVRSGLYDSLIARFACNSRTYKMGYVDESLFQKTYETFVRTGSPSHYFQHLWAWVTTEVCLQYHKEYARQPMHAFSTEQHYSGHHRE